MSHDLRVAVGGKIANLIPGCDGQVERRAVWVMSPASTVPERFRADQERRIAAYRATGTRMEPGSAVRFYVAIAVEPVAWVNVDGTTHHDGTKRGQRVAGSWPARFEWADPNEATFIPDYVMTVCVIDDCDSVIYLVPARGERAKYCTDHADELFPHELQD